MCIKTIYFDTYPDGTQKVSERVETCRPGQTHMCSQPKIKEYRRMMPHKIHVIDVERSPAMLGDRLPATYHHPDFLHLPPSPRRSKSPSPSGSESRRRRESAIFINGSKVANLKRRSTMREHPVELHRGRDRSPRAVDVHQPPFAPEPPSPRLHRSTTLPTHGDYVVIEERQPRANVARRRSRGAPLAPVQVLENVTGAVPGLARRASVAHVPRRRSPPPPVMSSPYVLVDDEELARADRRRSRAERRASLFVGGGLPGASGSDTTTSEPVVKEVVHPSAAAGAVRKELRWEDQQRAAQNARIAMRPKLHQEVRGILKHPSGTAPAVVVRDVDEVAALRRSMSGLAIESRETAVQRAARAELRKKRRDEEEEQQMKDRLAARFVLSGEGDRERRRGTRVYYPGEGLYKYL